MLTAVGRVWVGEIPRGCGFALGRRLAVTANHVASADDELSFAVDGRRIAVERVERDLILDVAILHLAEDAPAGLAVARAEPEARWRVEASPRDDDPMLSGSITATRWRITNEAGHELQAMQLSVDQRLDWHDGYSGGPVSSPPGADSVVGVLVEQVLSRAPQIPGTPRAASNVLYAVPIEDVLEGFGLTAQVEWVETPRNVGQDAAGPARRVVGLRVSPVVDHWRDRTEARDELRRELLAGQHHVVSVVGRRGIGKSALVAEVLAEFEEPDRSRKPSDDLGPLVYLSTRSSGGLTLSAVYQAVASLWDERRGRDLARRWQSAGVEGLADLWQKLHDRRPVLVLDDLDGLQRPLDHDLTDEKLVALLSSACGTPVKVRIVTTSQHALELPAGLRPHVHTLFISDGLQGADAVAVMRAGSVAGREGVGSMSDEKLLQLAGLVDGRPRGLQKLALLADHRPRYLARLLESGLTPDDVVDELVSTTYADLDADLRPVMQLLALAGAPFAEAEVAQVLAGLLDPAVVQDAIDRLVDAGEVNAEGGRLELHPLDADHITREVIAHEPERLVKLDDRLAAWWAGRRTPVDAWRTLDDATPGGRLVWTIHNVLPHDARHVWAEIQLGRLLASRADLVHVLSDVTVEAVRDYYELDPARVTVVPHSSYVGEYADRIGPQEARTALGIDAQDKVMLALGGIRPYKGLGTLLDVFDELVVDDPTLRLLVAGRPAPGEEVRRLVDRCEGHPRVLGEFRHVPDDRLQVWMRASDLAVLPYRQILNSGAFRLAETFGLPVVAPRTGAMVEAVGAPHVRLFEPTDGRSLRDEVATALRELVEDPEGAARASASARAAALAFTPDDMARSFATAIAPLLRD